MQELTDKIQAGLGRNLIGREVDGIHRLVKEHGTPEIEVGPPRFPGDKQRPVRLTWMVDGQPMPLLIQATAPPEKPRNMVREHLERQARERPGTFVTDAQRIGLDGRRTIDRRVDHFPAKHVLADRTLRSRPHARGAGRPKAQATRSSARSGDSGSGDGLGESKEPPKRRLCAFCNRELPPGKRRYCSDKHAGRDRQRRKRERDRQRTGVGGARAIRFRKDVHLGITEDGWDRHRRDPYKDFDTELWRGPNEPPELVTYEVLRDRVAAGCRCNGHHIELEDGHCTKCGHRVAWTEDRADGRPEAPYYVMLRKLDAEGRAEQSVTARLEAVAS